MLSYQEISWLAHIAQPRSYEICFKSRKGDGAEKWFTVIIMMLDKGFILSRIVLVK